MLYSTIVTNDDELIQINRLNLQNLRTNLSKQQKENEGFVTWLYPVSLLKEMHKTAPSIIVKDGDDVVGYALVTLKEASNFHHDLKIMIDNLDLINYKSKPVSSYKFYIMGQVCIQKYYRSKGIFQMLFQKHKELYSSEFDLLVTEISTANYRSNKAHEKVGFKTIHTYRDDLDDWNVVVWDWRFNDGQ